MAGLVKGPADFLWSRNFAGNIWLPFNSFVFAFLQNGAASLDYKGRSDGFPRGTRWERAAFDMAKGPAQSKAYLRGAIGRNRAEEPTGLVGDRTNSRPTGSKANSSTRQTRGLV